jgi:hypothetical protein
VANRWIEAKHRVKMPLEQVKLREQASRGSAVLLSSRSKVMSVEPPSRPRLSRLPQRRWAAVRCVPR